MNQDSDPNSDRPSDPSNQPNQPNLDILRQRMNLELETLSVNQLYNLAAEAMNKNLITAHGYRGGQYELLRGGEFILMSPLEAIQYLQTLLETTND